MESECKNYRNQIPQALMAELPEGSQQALDKHLAECAPCAEEHLLYQETLRQLHRAGDVEAPRHFFVYPEGRPNPWQVLRNLTFAWKVSLAAVAVAVFVLGGFALANLEIKAEAGSLTVRLGKPARPESPPPAPTVDLAVLKLDLLRVLEEKSRNDKVEMVRALRAELAQSESTLSKKQRLALSTALAALESRVDSRIINSAANLETGTQRSLATMYRALENQRSQDMSAINDRLNRVAVNGEIKSNQTDAILETLLQVAELRMK